MKIVPVKRRGPRKRKYRLRDVEDACREKGEMGALWLREGQWEIYDGWRKSKDMVYVMELSRRWGKSTILTVSQMDGAMKEKGSQWALITDTAKHARSIIHPIITEIAKRFRMDLRYDIYTSSYRLPNGSLIYLAGADSKQHEALRGLSLWGIGIDEAGYVDDLEYVVHDVCMPTTMTTGGRILLGGTPPESPAHYFTVLCEQLKGKGNYVRRTIEELPISEDVKRKYIEEAGGRESTTCRREYFCEHVVDEERAVVPEWTDEAEKECFVERARPKYWEWYAAMDPAFQDNTGYVAGYYDFVAGKYVVECELLLQKKNTVELALEIRMVEERMYGVVKPILRVSDTELQVIADLAQLHNLYFSPTKKDDKMAQVNYLRVLVKQKRLVVHPRCEKLRFQLKTAMWNKMKTGWERLGDGHNDLLDALIYFVRAIDITRNPYPVDYQPDKMQYVFEANDETKDAVQWAKMMPRRYE